jgi:peptide deformylase
MTIRKIAQIGHPVLREPARRVSLEEIESERVQLLIDDMIETMRHASGAGLAAPQVHEPLRIVVIEVSKNKRYPYKPDIPLTVLINPQVEPLSEDSFENYEGCLSVPNLRGVVRRWAEVRVTGLDRDGQKIDKFVRGFTAGTFQHELDHLNGMLFVDRVTDPRTLTTWAAFEAHHQAAWLQRANLIREKYGQ